jgi:NitT/TauT family transport system substrate-binding protein
MVAACGEGTTDSGGGGDGGSSELIRIGLGVDSSYAPFFLADAEGMFADAGLNVELLQFAVGGEGVDALSQDEVHLVGVSEVTAIGRLQQNADLRALLVYEQSGEYLKVVLREGIENVSDIRKMGVVPGLSELSTLKLLESENIDPATVELVTLGPPEAGPLLDQGDIDAFVMWEPWPTKAEELGARVAMTTGDYGWEYVHWLLGNQSFIEDNEDTLQTLADVLAEAAERTESEPDVAAEATEAATSVPTADTLTAIEEIDFEVRSITADDLPGLESVARYYVDTNKAETLPDVESAVLLDWYRKDG